MPSARRLLNAVRLPPTEVARVAEAAMWFHAYRLALRVVPVARLLGTPGDRDTAPEAWPVSVPPAVLDVRRALRRAAKGWPDTCLPQALAGRAMLRRRGLGSTLSLGTRRDTDEPGRMDFHAWLRSGGVIVNAGGGPREYAVLSTYHDAPSR